MHVRVAAPRSRSICAARGPGAVVSDDAAARFTPRRPADRAPCGVNATAAAPCCGRRDASAVWRARRDASNGCRRAPQCRAHRSRRGQDAGGRRLSRRLFRRALGLQRLAEPAFAAALAARLTALATPAGDLSRDYLEAAAKERCQNAIAAVAAGIAAGSDDAVIAPCRRRALRRSAKLRRRSSVLGSDGDTPRDPDHVAALRRWLIPCADAGLATAFPARSSLIATPRQIAPSST